MANEFYHLSDSLESPLCHDPSTITPDSTGMTPRLVAPAPKIMKREDQREGTDGNSVVLETYHNDKFPGLRCPLSESRLFLLYSTHHRSTKKAVLAINPLISILHPRAMKTLKYLLNGTL